MKRFLKTVALFFAPVALLAGLFGAALVRSGELAPMEEVRAAVAEGRLTLFGFAYRENTRAFKQAVAAARGAKVLVLGTSRSMQLRGDFFETDSFYNAGGGMAYVSQAQVFLENLPESARPRHLLLVLDQYFYNTGWSSIEPDDSGMLPPDTEPDAVASLRHMLWDYADGKFSLLGVLSTPKGVYGLTAAARGAGFYADGSYTYGSALLHPEQSDDADFADTFDRIYRGTSRFEWGDEPEARCLAETRDLLAYCAAQGIEVTAFLPPYAPRVWQQMQRTGKYGYIAGAVSALEEMFAQYGFEVFDYSYLPETKDDQYVDGFHGSDRVYAAVCARLARDSSLMGELFDYDGLMARFRSPGSPLILS